MKIRRVNPTQDALSPGEARGDSSDFGLDRVIYKKLSSLTDNKSLTAPTGPDTEYDRFLIEMEKIHSGLEVTEAMTLLDNYLGTLGVTEEYPFSDDTYSSSEWISLGEQEAYRNVVSTATDNIIVDVLGVDYNIIHRT